MGAQVGNKYLGGSQLSQSVEGMGWVMLVWGERPDKMQTDGYCFEVFC